MMPAEARWLKHWTAQAVQCMFSIWHDADPASFAADTSASIAYALQTVSTILRAAAHESVQVHPLCTLPRHVLRNIWSHMTLADAVALARTSPSLLSVVFYSPELWTDISTPNGEPTWVHYSDLQVYVEHSVAEPLRVSLFTRADMFVLQIPSLFHAMPRITTLRLYCWDLHDYPAVPGALRGSQTWSRLLVQALTEPAPRLVSFELRYVKGGVLDDCYNSPEPLQIYSPLFSGTAPCLRYCRLRSVLFPPPALCGAFGNVTTLSYTVPSDISINTIAFILEAVPRLEVLELDGTHISSGISSEPGACDQQHKVAQCPSLRVLLCSFFELQFQHLSPILPFPQLQELWLFVATTNICEEVGNLYPAINGIRLGIQPQDGIVASIDTGGSSTTPKVVFSSGEVRRLPDFLIPFASITWLCIHEHLLSNRAAGSPQALPALKVLCVRLAVPSEYVVTWPGRRHPARESSGFLINDFEEPPWELPALREVRIGAPFEESSAARPLSIAMHDVARWIRNGLAFGPVSQKLDAIVLSGVRIVDFDFCAGWNALREEAESIRLEESSDSTYFPAEGMLYQARAASLFPA